ncbi:ArsR/SmtB family transcription factor [Gordonia hydrophobica]|uniref:Metalloregulator ArsR/SmtB family transcription factor n=1 Tax=Gordonia hydrophobica TaxID=40516 RepID=A0ABZ2TZ94_9ACTN|nr:metalloregulator ArsR/SmtB family transcription factor [Gordonia hydrophobica]MBM7368900.1 DNA-binding transcriptional ArsR family regulator [Gordonia hydrophobica]
MGHRMTGGDSSSSPLDAATAERVATTLQALATPSRLLILSHLNARSMAVGELADAVEMEPSAVSHQLRLLRNLGLVVGTREGRSIVYRLYDVHVAQLLDEAVYHSEHLRMGIADTPVSAATGVAADV